MTVSPARTARQRTQDTLHRLENDIDLWVATADPSSGSPWLVPLSFHWDGNVVLIATTTSSATGRNLVAGGQVRLALGETRDVVLIGGEVERWFPAGEVAVEVGDTFAARAGFDPRQSASPFLFFEVRPLRIQAWREENELDGRLLMRDSAWLDAVATER